ncbi:hypothetical protein HPP92_016937 [Vanilla planifolia]|uniref:Isopentenyl phosphate kinase n=1 Tax=Vanilla planifolia TaxID=51239 RepID=A0A835UUN7_VANPL|nr:hypothetical protein HPP92_016937 [Vanilla planifolia]
MECRAESATPIVDFSPPQTLARHRPLRCIVKLGGAAITCKNELEKINEEILRVVCTQLREAMALKASESPAQVVGMDWSRRPGHPCISVEDDFGEHFSLDLHSNFIVVHGAGSFGHFQASRSGVHKGGLHLPLVKAGFVATRISVTSLNLEIVRALAREGITAVGMSPFACGWSTQGRNIAFADASQITTVLTAGFIPVLHGDAVLDCLQGCTILSGDVIIRHLAHLMLPEYVVFLTDVLGVYDRPPTFANATLLREIVVDEEGNWSIVKPTLENINQVDITVASHDTTGGMETKILEAAVIAKHGIDVYITKAGTDHSLRALKGPLFEHSSKALMQAVSVSTLTVPFSRGRSGTPAVCRGDRKIYSRGFVNPLVEGSFFWSQCMLSLYSINTNRSKGMGSRINAAWLFKGKDEELDATIEGSEASNEEILIFLFQLDFETRIQYALNTEQYDIAQQLRSKLDEVEAEIVKQQDAKRGSSKSQAQDKALNILRLQADLQKEIENENYIVAAELRDEISKLEADSLAASAKALAYQNAQYAYRLGQKVWHKVFGYRAVICGMDPVCCESSSWMEIANVDKLSRGPNQPFYQVLVDMHYNPDMPVAYVPEENLNSSDKTDLSRFDHPYVSFLFYGVDTAGDFIPVKQLREKFNRPRHEVPMDTEDGNGDDKV